MGVVEAEVAGDAMPHGRVEVQGVAGDEEVVAGERAVELDGVVAGEVGEVEGRGVACRGELEVDGVLEGLVERRRLVVVRCRDGAAQRGQVDGVPRAGQEAVVGERVEAGAGGAV